MYGQITYTFALRVAVFVGTLHYLATVSTVESDKKHSDYQSFTHSQCSAFLQSEHPTFCRENTVSQVSIWLLSLPHIHSHRLLRFHAVMLSQI